MTLDREIAEKILEHFQTYHHTSDNDINIVDVMCMSKVGIDEEGYTVYNFRKDERIFWAFYLEIPERGMTFISTQITY